MGKKLIAFDMDSTLIQCEVIDELARKHNCYQQVSEITQSAMKGEINFSDSLSKRVGFLKGLSITVTDEIIKNLPCTHGLEKLIKYLKKNDYIIAILSGGFDLFAHAIRDKFNFDYVYTNRLEVKHTLLTGELLGEIIDAEKKSFYLKKIAHDEHISMKNTVAVGDGSNDIPMLQEAEIGIAFSAKETVKNATPYHIDEIDLSLIIQILDRF